MAESQNNTNDIINVLKAQLDLPVLFSKLSEMETTVKVVKMSTENGKVSFRKTSGFYKPVIRVIK
jgi:hypothetical protein